MLVYETSAWATYLTLTDAKLKGNFTVCGFSECGKFIAAGTTKGELVVWTALDGKRVSGKAEGESDEPITSLSWNPNGLRQFVYADKSGQIGCVNVEMGSTNGGAAKADIEDGMEIGKQFIIFLSINCNSSSMLISGHTFTSTQTIIFIDPLFNIIMYSPL